MAGAAPGRLASVSTQLVSTPTLLLLALAQSLGLHQEPYWRFPDVKCLVACMGSHPLRGVVVDAWLVIL